VLCPNIKPTDEDIMLCPNKKTKSLRYYVMSNMERTDENIVLWPNMKPTNEDIMLCPNKNTKSLR
jgi:tRNA A22 N-methylase